MTSSRGRVHKFGWTSYRGDSRQRIQAARKLGKRSPKAVFASARVLTTAAETRETDARAVKRGVASIV